MRLVNKTFFFPHSFVSFLPHPTVHVEFRECHLQLATNFPWDEQDTKRNVHSGYFHVKQIYQLVLSDPRVVMDIVDENTSNPMHTVLYTLLQEALSDAIVLHRNVNKHSKGSECGHAQSHTLSNMNFICFTIFIEYDSVHALLSGWGLGCALGRWEEMTFMIHWYGVCLQTNEI